MLLPLPLLRASPLLLHVLLLHGHSVTAIGRFEQGGLGGLLQMMKQVEQDGSIWCVGVCWRPHASAQPAACPAEDQRKDLEGSVQKLTDDYVKQVSGWDGRSLRHSPLVLPALRCHASELHARPCPQSHWLACIGGDIVRVARDGSGTVTASGAWVPC